MTGSSFAAPKKSSSGGGPSQSSGSSGKASSPSARRGVGSSFGTPAAAGASGDGGVLSKVPGLSMLGKTLQLLDVGRRGVMSVVKELDDASPDFLRAGGLKGNAAGMDRHFSLGDIGKNYKANIGAGDLAGSSGNKWVDRGIGLAGDIAFDPLSYLTLGAGPAAKLAEEGAIKLGAKETAGQLARRVAESGDKELANKILTRGGRGSANVLSKEEALRFGIRQGPTFGIGKTRVAVPYGDKLARTVSKALSPVTDQLSKLPLHGIGNALKGATPLERQLARDADRGRRLAAKGAGQTAKHELSQLLGAHPDLNMVTLRDSLEGAATHPAAADARKILDTYHSWAEEQLGRKLPYIDDYLTHRLTAEAKAARTSAGKKVGAGGLQGVMRERTYRAGDTFFGEVLQDGSITEMNRIYAAKVGAKHALFEENPVKLIHQYIDDLTSNVSKSADSFATAAGAVDPVLKAVPGDGATAAAKEASRIEKAMKKVDAELEKTKGKIAKGQDKVAANAAEQATNHEKLLDALGRGQTFDGPRVGNPSIESAAKHYIKREGLSGGEAVDRALRVDDEFAKRLAVAYDALPAVGGPEATASYDALKGEVEKQYKYLTEELGIKVEFVDGFPYDDAAKMMADVRQNKRLLVNRTTLDQTHPFFTPDQNDMFRAVHDFFGHAQAGNRFDRHGEEVAYRLHAQMFSDGAVPAMTTETRGQNAYLNYHPDNVARRAAGESGQFPPQKAALLPAEFIGANAPSGVELAMKELKDAHVQARADVSAALKPQVMEHASTLDHIAVVTDPETVIDQANANLKSLDALRVIKHKAKMEELALREHADFLFTESARLRAAGDHEMANIAGLEAQARKMEADIPNLDARFQKAMAVATSEKMVNDIDAMTRQGLVQLADGRYAEPWVATAAEQITRAMQPANIGRLIKEFDRISGYWRATALLSPGFHMRNAFGGFFNNSLADMDWSRYTQFIGANKQFKKGGLEAIKDPEVRRAIEAATRLGQYEGADISEVSKLAGMNEGGKIVGRQNPLFRGNFKVGQTVEQNLRMPLFIDTYIKSGGDEMAALDAVMKYHFDYEDLSRAEREVGRRAFGFYTWSRNNLPLMMSEMADHPGAFTRYTHLKRNMEMGTDPENRKPGYFNEALAIALPFKFKGGQIYAFPDLPFISAAQSFGGVNQVASSLNPLIKLPVETFTNTKFFERRQMSPTMKATPAAWKPILELLVHNPGIPGLPKVHKAKDGTLMMDEREANKIESLFPMLARLRRLAPSEKKYQDRVLTSWLSFAVGVSMRTLDQATIGGEIQRRKQAAAAQTKVEATLAGGQKLNDYKAAQRQAAAIKAAQQGR